MRDWLSGRVALVTGAAAGIGRTIAMRFVAEGAALVLVDINDESLDKIGSELQAARGAVVLLSGDVGQEETLRRAVAAAQQHFGRLDVLVNNAMASVDRSITEMTAEEWHFSIQTCLTSTFYGAKHAIPAMQRLGKGAIINMSSVNSLMGVPGLPAYTAAKGGIVGLTRQLAVEWAPYGIRTNAIRPGFIDTESNASVMSDADEVRATIEACPLRRVGQPEEVASLAAFLASDEAAYINGQVITVDGGTSLQWPMTLLRPSLRRKAGLPPLPAGDGGTGA